MKPIGCIIYVCVSILHAQRMSNIFSLIVPLYYIGCLLFTHNTQNTQNPPPPPKSIKGCMNCIFEERHIGELTNSPVQFVHTFFKSYTLTVIFYKRHFYF